MSCLQLLKLQYIIHGAVAHSQGIPFRHRGEILQYPHRKNVNVLDPVGPVPKMREDHGWPSTTLDLGEELRAVADEPARCVTPVLS